ncbi:MAG: CRISPR-associated endonuclease Cas2 [Candidatus Methanomethylicota archaeon]|uniref:CRISPR-associated endoribonuclease Cas2 n=1 Tax=Thermoproteota archaeon TaxID=2056631 RepID=A0A497EM25_9CREN|nr:MAG: CRISPR-associated endonuclease Cas2 [Candidatus Verstraetearchaeota archaeon]
MKVLVIYDITENDLREHVAKKLKSMGLTRIQKSAFIGYLDSSARKDLKRWIQRQIQGHKANVQFYPLCRYCYSQREEVGVPTVEESLLRSEIVVV